MNAHSITKVDLRMMMRVAQLAARAEHSGNTAVGTIIARADRIIVEAEEQTPIGPDPFAHAEIVAVRGAMNIERGSLGDATLYTNVEPCFLCSHAIREAGIGRVVIDRSTPQIGGITSSYPLLQATGITRWGNPPQIIWFD